MPRYQNRLSICVRRAFLVLLALVMLAAPGLAYAQQELNAYTVPSLNWYTMYGNSATERAQGMTTDSSGNIFVVGTTIHGWLNTGMAPLHPFTPGQPDRPNTICNNNLVIAKFDSAGTLIWYTYYASSIAFSDARSILIDASGNLYIIGESYAEWDGVPPAKRSFHGPNIVGNGIPNDDVFILKLNNAGAYQWHTFYGSDMIERDFEAVLDSSGNVVVAGSTEASWADLTTPKRPFSGGNNFFAVSVDPKGDYRWHTFYGMERGQVYIGGMQIDPAGDIYLAGNANDAFIGFQPQRPRTSSEADILLMKMSKEGVLQWYTFYGGTGGDRADALTINSGNLYLTGNSGTSWPGFNPLHPLTDSNDGNLFVLKLNSAGAYQWHTFYGPGYGKTLAVDGQGRIFVAGSGYDFPGLRPITPYIGDWDNVLLILDAQGNYASHAYYGFDWHITYYHEGVSEIRIVGNKLYMFGDSGFVWPNFPPPLHAAHIGDDTFLASISIVEKPSSATSTHLEVTSNPSEIGRTITLTADIMSDGGVPTAGKVTFKDGATIIGSADLINGQANLNFTPLSLGIHAITAQYSGTPGFLPSQTPGSISLEIVKASTRVYLTDHYANSTYGTEATFSVYIDAVNPNIYQTGGWVVLKEGTRVIASALATNARAVFRISDLPVGDHSITAESVGGDIFAPSTSPAVIHHILKADTSTTLTALPSDTLSYGSDLTLKATVTHAGSPSVKPDGTVTFLVNDHVINPVTLTNGAASVTIHKLPPGTHIPIATYSGSSNFNPANELVGRVITITRGVPRVTLTPEGGSAINSGETKRLTITVQGAYPDLVQPTGVGMVKLYEGETEIAVLELINGVAISEPLALSDGAHSFTAIYTGDTCYLSETSRPAVVIVAGTPTYLPVMVR